MVKRRMSFVVHGVYNTTQITNTVINICWYEIISVIQRIQYIIKILLQNFNVN